MRLASICIFLLAFTGAQAQKQEASGGPLKPEQANMDIRHYTVSLDVDPVRQSYSGYTEIKLGLATSATDMIFDLVSDFTVSSLTVDGNKTPYTHSDGLIRVKAAAPMASGTHLVRIAFSGKPPVAVRPPWDGGIQWSTDSLGRPWIAMSCQQDGADIFFPCKDHPSDEPNEGADLIVSVPKGLVVAGPGLLVKQTTSGKRSMFHWKTNYTINTYSILFNIGYYSVARKTYTTVAGNKVPMEFYVLDYNLKRGDRHLELLERSCRLLEKYFGEYPWVKEKIGIAETPHLGMEHQTLNAYGNKFRYVKMGAVDFDWLLTHEFGHEWWGNKVSNSDWAHMWIHEGICSFADALFYEEYGGRQAYLDRMKDASTKFSNALPIVQGDVVDSRQTYNLDIYTKGAYFMHTLRYVVGDSVFFPAIKSFTTSPQYTYNNLVTTGQLMKHFNAAAGRDLEPLFRLFLYTTDKLQVGVRQTGLDTYEIKLLNLDMSLPMEVLTSAGKIRGRVDGKPVNIRSTTMPVIDPDAYYLKKITME
jgi:aminopeptidase N